MKVLWFLIKEGFRNLLRSKFAGAFTILIIWFSLTFVSFGYIISRDLVSAVNSLKSQFDINIFIDKAATQQNINDFAKKLDSTEEIQTYTFISKDKAATKFKQQFGKDVLEVLDYNPLPPSFNIKLAPIYRNLTSVESITTDLSQSKIVEEIKYKKKFLVVLAKYQRAILYGVIGAFVLSALISIILISNTIKMGIFSRRDIISTMKLIGATDNFIRAPFIIEGILQGTIGAILSGLTLKGTAYLVNNYLQTVLDYNVVLNLNIFLVVIASGALIGCLGSLRAIRKFL